MDNDKFDGLFGGSNKLLWIARLLFFFMAVSIATDYLVFAIDRSAGREPIQRVPDAADGVGARRDTRKWAAWERATFRGHRAWPLLGDEHRVPSEDRHRVVGDHQRAVPWSLRYSEYDLDSHDGPSFNASIVSVTVGP